MQQNTLQKNTLKASFNAKRTEVLFSLRKGTMVDNNAFPSTHNAQSLEAKKVSLQNKPYSQGVTLLLSFFFLHIPFEATGSGQSRVSIMPSSVSTQNRK